MTGDRTTGDPRSSSRAGNTIAWIIAVALALLFAFAGVTKLIGMRAMVQAFEQIGFGQWLRYLTGTMEVSGAIGILIPRVRFWAALDLAAVMVGATVTNLFILRTPGAAALTVALLVLTLALAWRWRPQSA